MYYLCIEWQTQWTVLWSTLVPKHWDVIAYAPVNRHLRYCMFIYNDRNHSSRFLNLCKNPVIDEIGDNYSLIMNLWKWLVQIIVELVFIMGRISKNCSLIFTTSIHIVYISIGAKEIAMNRCTCIFTMVLSRQHF